MKNLFAFMLLCTASVFFSCSNNEEDEINDDVDFNEIVFPYVGISGVYESVVIGYSNNIEEYYFIETSNLSRYEGKYLKVSIDKDSVKTVEKGVFVYKDYWAVDIAASCQHAYIYFSPSGECKESELFHCWGKQSSGYTLKFIPVNREKSEKDVLPNTYERNERTSSYEWIYKLISDLGIDSYFAGFKLVD